MMRWTTTRIPESQEAYLLTIRSNNKSHDLVHRFSSVNYILSLVLFGVLFSIYVTSIKLSGSIIRDQISRFAFPTPSMRNLCRALARDFARSKVPTQERLSPARYVSHFARDREFSLPSNKEGPQLTIWPYSILFKLNCYVLYCIKGTFSLSLLYYTLLSSASKEWIKCWSRQEPCHKTTNCTNVCNIQFWYVKILRLWT